MYFTGSMLSLGASICLHLLTANASPIPNTTLSLFDELRTNLSAISFEICKDNVRSKGCEPLASLIKRVEHPEPTSLCGEDCKIFDGECICPREPLASLIQKVEHPEPTSLCGENCKMFDGECICPPKHVVSILVCGSPCKMIEGECICPNYGPLVEIPRPYRTTVIEDEPTPTATPTDDDDDDDATPTDDDDDDDATPTEISSLEHRQILETRAVDGTKPSHTLSPRDNEEELREPVGVPPPGLCQHKERDCTRWHGILLPTEAAVVSRRNIDHHVLSHRADEAQPTVTQTSTTTHFPTPTAAFKECPENDRQCQGSFLPPPQLEKAKNKNPKMMCPMDDWECQNRFDPPVQEKKGRPGSVTPLCTANDPECPGNKHNPPPKAPGNGFFPPPKAEKEEKRDVDVVLPTATGTSEVKPNANCVGAPYLCLD